MPKLKSIFITLNKNRQKEKTHVSVRIVYTRAWCKTSVYFFSILQKHTCVDIITTNRTEYIHKQYLNQRLSSVNFLKNTTRLLYVLNCSFPCVCV